MSTSPNTQFWGGSTVKGGRIRPLEVATFKELVALLNVPVVLPFTRGEWVALSQDERNAAKDGPYICACSFKPGTTLRNDANAEQLLLVCFDIDEPDLARPFAESPETLDDHLFPWSFVAWTTASSTPEAPRLRIVIPVEACDPENHKRIVFYMASRLGLPKDWKGKRESNTLSLPFYRPVQLQGETESNVIRSRTNGPAFELIDLPPDVVEEVDRTYGYKAGFDENESLDDLPIPGLEVEDVREALFAIDPSCKYGPWTMVVRSFKHQWRQEDEAAEAFEMLADWSEGGTNFKSRDDVYAKWRSFTPDFKGQRPTTIRSLFHLASTEYGWSNVKVSRKLELSVEEKIDECTDPKELMREGPKWVASLPFTSAATEEDLFTRISRRITQLRGNKISIAALKKDMAKHRRAARAEATGSSAPSWLRPWCYISGIDRFYSTVTGIELTAEAFNRTHGHRMMPAKDSPGGEEAQVSNRPVVQPADFALNNTGMITIADELTYDPRHGGEKLFFRIPGDEKVYVNQYRTNTLPKPDEKNAPTALKGLKRLLNVLLPRREDILHMLDFLAFAVQNPGKRIRHVPFIQGVQGCGKTFVSRYLTAAIGKPNAKIVGPNEIFAPFNDWATGAQLVTIEEIWTRGRDKAEVMNKLKPLTTNDQVPVSRKHRDAATMENFTIYLAFSNHHVALYLEPGDRRWWVIKSPLQSESQKISLAASEVSGMKFFDYHGMLCDKYPGAIRHALLNYEVRSSFDPNGDAPKTPWREQIIHESTNILQREIASILLEDHPLVSRDIIFLPSLERLLPQSMMRNNHPPEHYLYNLGFQPHGGPSTRFGINGSGKGQIWVHNERFDECSGDPHEILLERYDEIPEDSL